MSLYQVFHRTTLPGDLATIYYNISDPARQLMLCPPQWNVQLIQPFSPIGNVGECIDFSFRCMGQTHYCTTIVRQSERPFMWSDSLIRGPFAYWFYERRLLPENSKVLLEETITYRPKRWWHQLFLPKKIESFLHYRSTTLVQFLEII